MALDRVELEPGVLNDTLGVLLKYQDDIAAIRGKRAADVLAEVDRALRAGT
jgi:hypothetical protein